VDELNSVLGLLLTEPDAGGEYQLLIQSIQNDLFDVGSDLCVPGEAGERLRIPKSYVERLEKAIDEANKTLKPLNSFVLPGGSRSAAWLHLARTVCRRAEREIVALAEREPNAVNPELVHYINRLSDLFFVLARHSNAKGAGDVLWVPGKSGQP
jgi:cob(I)alamin adenosyltransferase